MTAIKWDGHTHTEFCQHGSGDSTAAMVERAIEAGFTHYSITEHAPLPDGFFPTETLQREFGLLPREMRDYFDLIQDLKAVYARKIRILCGLEVDYLQGYEEFTKNLIASYEEELEELMLSVHFMNGKNGHCCIDYSPDIFRKELIAHYGSADRAHDAYWQVIRDMVSEQWPTSIPIRIGHLGVVNKFIKAIPLQNGDRYDISYFRELFHCVKKRGYCLDANVAGLAVETCRETYLTAPMRYWSKKLQIGLVYGSDAHSTKAVGHFYDVFEKKMQSK